MKVKGSERSDQSIIEKQIYAFHLLEELNLIFSEFIFKGGTSLSLLVSDFPRFSVDIDILVNPKNDDLQKIVLDATNGYGADVAIVAAPAAYPQETAPGIVRKKGIVCLFASLPVGNEMLSMNSRTIHYGEINIVGSSDSTAEHVKKAVEMISEGKIDGDKLVTHTFGFEDIFKAFELMVKGESLRVVLKP